MQYASWNVPSKGTQVLSGSGVGKAFSERPICISGTPQIVWWIRAPLFSLFRLSKGLHGLLRINKDEYVDKLLLNVQDCLTKSVCVCVVGYLVFFFSHLFRFLDNERVNLREGARDAADGDEGTELEPNPTKSSPRHPLSRSIPIVDHSEP